MLHLENATFGSMIIGVYSKKASLNIFSSLILGDRNWKMMGQI